MKKNLYLDKDLILILNLKSDLLGISKLNIKTFSSWGGGTLGFLCLKNDYIPERTKLSTFVILHFNTI